MSYARSSHRRWALLISAGIAGVLIAALAGFGTPKADAASPLERFEVNTSTTQAGAHPDVAFRIEVHNRHTQGHVNPCNCSDPKDVRVSLPEGFIGNPHAAPKCSATDFAAAQCPTASQVGVAAYTLGSRIGEGSTNLYLVGLYNMEPHTDQAGLLAFPAVLANTPIYIVLSARTGSDYGLDATTTGIERTFPPFVINEFLWGVPADPSHDALRFPKHLHEGNPVDGPYTGCGLTDSSDELEESKFPPTCGVGGSFPPLRSEGERLPFLSNPTACGGELPVSIETLSYDTERAFASNTYRAITGCDQLGFTPSLTAQPTTSEADTATGLDVTLSVPQPLSADVPSGSQIRSLVQTLPKGFSLNPSGADGKRACTDVEGAFGTEDEAHCPEFSKVGTSVLDSSALPGPIKGAIYIGQPEPGQKFRLIVTADGFATHVKVKGNVHLDPATGQVVTSFPELPQAPFQELSLHFFGSERGVFATPSHCGTYKLTSRFVPWADALPEQTSTSFFEIDSGPGGSPCPSGRRPFNPRLQAATEGNTAGADTPFWLHLERDDGDQTLSLVDTWTPPGFAATLKGIPYCPEGAIATLNSPFHTGLAELSSPACPAASQIGTVVSGAGAGTRSIHNSGRVFLAGPYKGAPLSLVIGIPALGGPYDLGNVAVRVAIYVDPVTAQVRALSDPLPQIQDGVPLRARSILVKLDRPGFTLNPTNCRPFAVTAAIGGGEGGVANAASPFQVANCNTLPYAPKLTLRLSGGVKRRGHPAIHAVFRARPGHANSRRISVTLPKGELLDNSHIRTICTRVQFAAGNCPRGSRIGTAKAFTPLLDNPLKGSVYLRSSTNKLPDMVVDLEGQLDLELAGRIDSVRGRLRTTFTSVPDARVRRFVLDLSGGGKGLLQNSEGLCGRKKRATVRMTGQNGAILTRKSRLRVACKSKSKTTRHLSAAHRGGAER